MWRNVGTPLLATISEVRTKSIYRSGNGRADGCEGRDGTARVAVTTRVRNIDKGK